MVLRFTIKSSGAVFTEVFMINKYHGYSGNGLINLF